MRRSPLPLVLPIDRAVRALQALTKSVQDKMHDLGSGPQIWGS
jgi:hypothetical protein